ncbi:MAG: CDP-glycerol glycerophosphotransferase family protein [Clostridia bacterium]|nr:CDP-glycerol glycerophosphotransferase family protein [Clostridia bacterium]
MKTLLKKIFPPKIRRKLMDFINNLWCFICRLMPLQNRVLFFTVRANGKLLDNAQAVYDALDCKKVIFARMLPHSTKIKPKIYYYLLTSKVIVTDDYVRYVRFTKLRKNQKLFQIWHACGAFKKFGLDAKSVLTEKEERLSHTQYSAVAVTSESCRKAYAHAFGISEDICLPIGLPRTDMLFTKADELRASIYEKYPEFVGKKIYLFAPTFREKGRQRIEYNPQIDWDSLSKELADDEIFVIRRHPIMNYSLTDNKEYNNIIDLSQDSTLALTAVSDVLITDYSSVIYDACLLDVPTVFYCPDYKEYNRGFYLKFPDDLPGEMVTSGAELLSAIRRTKENPPADRIEEFRNGQMSACDGHSTERAAALIMSWMK